MKSTIVAVVIAIGIVAMPVGASVKTAPSSAHSVASTAVASTAVAAAPATGSTTTYALNKMRNVPVAGTAAGGKVFRGTVNIVNFQNINGRLMAIANLNGRLLGPAGAVLGRVSDVRVRMPVGLSDGTNVHTSVSANAAAACDILHLHLGALDLNLLGLVVHLDPVRLDITAQPGPGNLLGNLLCAISGLLDNTNVNDVLVNLLRAVLQILNGL